VRHHALRIAGQTLERWLNDDRSDEQGPRVQCTCGQQARYAGRRERSFVTVLGDLRLRRAYYHCAACQSGVCPRDATLGLDGGSVSPAVTRMMGSVGARVSFQEGRDLLAELAGVRVTTKQVERTAEALGARLAEQERTVVETANSQPTAPTLYVGLDGTGIPVRNEELAGRAGKQPDGSAKTREVKLCAVWSAEATDSEGRPCRDPGSVTYSAAIESAALHDRDPGISAFAERVLRETRRRDFDRAQRRVILADGAAWIWNLASEHFPDAIQILDRYHAKQHLAEASRAIWGPEPGTELAQGWLPIRYQELDAGDVDALIAAYSRHATSCPEARLCAEYLATHRHRMRYPEFHALGLCTSSGVLEAGCRVAVAQRLKRSGMHWTTRGANAILALRCTVLSGRYEAYWTKRKAA
jgi:hypothetical protein